VNLSEDDRAVLARTEEVQIETRSATRDVHRTIIWIVVSGEDAFIRSVNGHGARWYREATERPDVDILVDGRTIPVLVQPAADPDAVRQCSEALAAKYRREGGSLRAMLKPSILPTTLRVVARP
jgi:hypothetical protein